MKCHSIPPRILKAAYLLFAPRKTLLYHVERLYRDLKNSSVEK